MGTAVWTNKQLFPLCVCLWEPSHCVPSQTHDLWGGVQAAHWIMFPSQLLYCNYANNQFMQHDITNGCFLPSYQGLEGNKKSHHCELNDYLDQVRWGQQGSLLVNWSLLTGYKCIKRNFVGHNTTLQFLFKIYFIENTLSDWITVTSIIFCFERVKFMDVVAPLLVRLVSLHINAVIKQIPVVTGFTASAAFPGTS